MGQEKRRRTALTTDEIVALLTGTNPSVYREGQVFSDDLGWGFVIVKTQLKKSPFSITWRWVEMGHVENTEGNHPYTFKFKDIRSWAEATDGFKFTGRRQLGQTNP